MANARCITKYGALLLSVGFLGGCAGLQPVEARRSPYRSAMLNADFTSAYPRRVTDDPLGLVAEAEPSPYASPRGDVARAEAPAQPRRNDQDEAAALPPVRRDDEGESEAAYAPEVAAAYVTAVYLANETQTTDAGVETPGVIDVYRHAQRQGGIYHSTRPAIGDLVFFHNTYDRNGDGRNNDWYTHVGMIEGVDESGRISILSYLDHQVSRTYLNLEQPEATQDGDQIVNTVMRRRSENDPPYTQYLASELFAGFANLLGNRTEFLVIDNWQPGMGVASAQ